MKQKLKDLIFPFILLLFVLGVVMLPAVIGLTYATGSQRPEHSLTYEERALVWDRGTYVRPDGSGQLSFFDASHDNVAAKNSDNLVAPGTGKSATVRLLNKTKKEIAYTAVLYMISTSPELGIEASFSGDDESGFREASQYTLPAGIEPEMVVRAVRGKLAAREMQHFELGWFWDYEKQGALYEQDSVDTYHGDKAAEGKADEVLLGFWLAVHDGGDITPVPKTGDNTMIVCWLILAAVSGVCLYFILRRKRRHEDDD